jgi:hypothetical protein
MKPPVVLALRDPLLAPDVSIAAYREGPDGPTEPFWTKVSSAHKGMSLAVWRLIGESSLGHGLHGWRNAFADVPRVAAYEKYLRDDLIEDGTIAVLGQDVLSKVPWEIDWDKGTLTLGAPAWPPGEPGAVRVPIERRDGVDLVVMKAAEYSFEMALSTTLHRSIVPEIVGIPRTPFDLGALPNPDHEFIADPSIGPVSIGLRRFSVPRRKRLPYGFLGLDVLGCVGFRVVPGRELWLRPRKNDAETARERIARFVSSDGCRHLGCVEAHVDRGARPKQLVVDVERAFSFPPLLVLACAGDATPIVPSTCNDRLWRSLHGVPLDPPHHMVVPLPAKTSGRIVRPIDDTPSVQPWEWPCADLTLVDVVPLEPKKDERSPSAHPWSVEAQFWWEALVPGWYLNLW